MYNDLAIFFPKKPTSVELHIEILFPDAYIMHIKLCAQDTLTFVHKRNFTIYIQPIQDFCLFPSL